MATALQLNSASIIINGHGLGVSANVLAAITTIQSSTNVKLMSNIATNASTADANISGNLTTALTTLGQGVTRGQFLIDLYPSNVTPVSSGGVVYYLSGNLASFSNTFLSHADIFFAHGNQGFANVYSTAYTRIVSALDTRGSISMLQTKTYKQSGLGYKGQLDLATGGIGTNGPLLASVVADWGTMYDINNMGKFTDPYVFGQNLLQQGLGSYGNLSNNLSNSGLNVQNLTSIPTSTVSYSVQSGTNSFSTFVGQVDIPTVSNVATPISRPGSSPAVVADIYSQVTGGNLAAIVSATGITTTTTPTTLADYLNFNKIVDPSLIPQLANIGIVTFPGLSSYLQKVVGKGSFTSWSQLATFFRSIDVPKITANSNTNGSSLILSSSAIGTMNNITGTGPGPFQNPTLTQYFGVISGVPYDPLLTTISSNFKQLESPVISALSVLDRAVTTYINGYTYDSFTDTYTYPDDAPIYTAVNGVNSALNSLTDTPALEACQTAYYQILSNLATEVSSIHSAGLVFDAGNPDILKSFAQTVASNAADKTTYNTYQLFANITTHDSDGDTIRAAISEQYNQQILTSAGFSKTNDPQPSVALVRSQQLGVPLSTYISQNQ